MLTDSHCHPFDTDGIFPETEQERRRLGVLAAASACLMEEFAHNELLAHNAALEQAAPILQCFGVHPQIFKVMFADNREQATKNKKKPVIDNLLENLELLASQKRITAIGECGFDLYNCEFRESEADQERVFAFQLEIAVKYDLPVALHVRRAMHKIFPLTEKLLKCKAVIFHSWSGTYEEGAALLRKGVNAYFSFGNTIMLNHKQAMRSCALLPAERLLTETDAPYQPRLGQPFSQWSDIPLILEAAAALRCEAGNTITAKELETQTETNFRMAFNV